MVGDVGDFFHFDELADAQCAAGELVDPGEAREIGLAGKLIQRGAGQVVRLIHHEQAVVQLGQQPRAQGGQQQVVVGHDDLRGHQFLAALVIGALAEHRAVLAGARAGLCAHGAPDFGLGRGVERVAVAIPCAARQGVGHGGVELHARLGFGARALGAFGGLLFGEKVIVGHVAFAIDLAAAGKPFQL
ncbi:hypothetical protein SDC9_107720 [bioreactor metagenome]|uniref:Uncharacterized protein n=1 Tax=bioreactor metagenome TaxID=1076179 RepID=A0A645B731_9ZZZZ